MRLAVALALVIVIGLPARPGAQPLDATAGEALAATLQMLLDPAQRAAAIAGSPQAGALDQHVRTLAGSDALTQEFYALAADVFQELTQASGGDVAKMSDALARGSSDPAGFAGMLSPRTLERLRQLSIKISDQRR